MNPAFPVVVSRYAPGSLPLLIFVVAGDGIG
jgi:hypothetical protein